MSIQRIKAEVNGKSTFLLKLENIRTTDIVSHIEKEVDKSLDKINEYQGNVEKLSAENYEDTGFKVGFENLPKLSYQGNGKIIIEYLPVEQLMEKTGISKEKLLSEEFANFSEVNRE